jgi:3-deoxy-D-manno-octulosonate 8-phosphate phosphatase (KDO 8-P phosphatase)
MSKRKAAAPAEGTGRTRSPGATDGRHAGIDEALRALVTSIRLVVFDFDGVFTDNTVYVSETGEEMVRCWRSDGLGLRKLERLGLDMLILSTETNPVVSLRAKKLKIACVQGVEDKRTALRRLARQHGVPLAAVAYLGNDINDLGCLETVGLPAAVRDAHPDVLPAVRYQTTALGGFGAVREFCDLFQTAHDRPSVRRRR